MLRALCREYFVSAVRPARVCTCVVRRMPAPKAARPASVPAETAASHERAAPPQAFAALARDTGLDRRLVKAVAKLGYVYPTPAQAQGVPVLLTGRDVLLRARTGSGKTAAYALAMLQRVLMEKAERGAAKAVLAVVLVPTRELVEQTVRALAGMSYYCEDVIRVVGVSGSNTAEQLARIAARPDIVVATPGRMAMLLAGAPGLLQHTISVVVDEADLTLAHGFTPDLHALLAALPRESCQVTLVSATLSPALDELRRVALRAPVMLRIEEGGAAAGTLSQFFVRVGRADKFLLLFALLKLRMVAGKTIIFVNDSPQAFKTKLFLERFSIAAAVLNGELPVASRLHILESFNRGVFDYLIATDASLGGGLDVEDPARGTAGSSAAGVVEDATVGGDDAASAAAAAAAGRASGGGAGRKRRRADDAEYAASRGVDFRNVSTVINLDFPETRSSYVHRIGRTARGGTSGVALSMLLPVGMAPTQDALLVTLQAEQTPDPATGAPQPSPLPFDLHEVESFRYRVDDVLRSITKAQLKEARLTDIRAELLASETLAAHFEDNPREAELLKKVRHDHHLAPRAIKPHLKDVPDYLMPPSLRAAVDAAGADLSSAPAGGRNERGRGKARSGGRGRPPRGGVGRGEARGGGGGDGGKVAAAVAKAQDDVYRPKRSKDPLKNLANRK